MKKFLENHGIVYKRSEIKPLLSGKPFIETVRTIQRVYELEGKAEDLAEERKVILRDVFDREGIEFIPGFQGFYREVGNGYKTCIATSTLNELFKISDEQLGLTKLFKGNIFTLQDTGCTNKSELFSYAVRKLKSKKKDSIVIEDAPSGVEAARKAGIRCVALTTTFDAEKLSKADLVVDSYSQISEYLRRV